MLNRSASSTRCASPVPEHLALGERTPRFFLAGPKRTLLVDSVQESVQLPAADPSEIRRALRDISTRIGPGYWVGALPFDNALPSHLLRPHSVKRRLSLPPPPRSFGTPLVLERIATPSTRETYQAGVENALTRIRTTDLEKVVLAQHAEYRVNRIPHLPTLLGELQRRNPEGTTYAMTLPASNEGEEKLLVGSSPELLVSKYGCEVRCLPLAGSRRRSLDPKRDRELELELKESSKDREEHALLREQLLADLAPWAEDLVYSQQPQTIRTSTMWHLGTPIVGKVRSAASTSLDLAMALHPSAAVCGVPREAALKTICEVESVSRGFYAGALGAMNELGDGEWIVTIRGAEISGTRVNVFSGAGVVRGSSPEFEFQETEDKKQTILQAIAAAVE